MFYSICNIQHIFLHLDCWILRSKRDDIQISQTARAGQRQTIPVSSWARLSIKHLQGQNDLFPPNPSAHVPLSCHKRHSFTDGDVRFKRHIQVRSVMQGHVIRFSHEPSDIRVIEHKKSIFYEIIQDVIKTGFCCFGLNMPRMEIC